MEDDKIVALYWRRDEAAIAESEGKYGRVLHSIAYAVLTSREDSEECVNDTYGKAWGSMPPQKPGSLLAFLGRITRNLSINRWHTNHAQKRDAGLLAELDECIPAAQTVESTISERELADIITTWLKSLPRQNRAAFLRRYWYGESVNDLALACGVTPNQMAGRMFRMRGKLRMALEKEGITI